MVIKLMNDAKLVIINVGGGGQGLEVEIDYAIKNVPFRKQLFYLDMKKKEYKKFRNDMMERFLLSFPPMLKPSSPVKGFFRFKKDRKIEYLPLRNNFFRTSGFGGKKFVTQFKYALKPVFEDFGIKWEEPPLSNIAVISAVFFVVLIISAIFYGIF